MTIAMSQELLGRFDKSVAQQYLGMLRDQGIQLSIEKDEQVLKQTKIKVYVAKTEYERAVNLIKEHAIRIAIQTEQDRKRFDRKVMFFFFSFVSVFILYIILTHI